MVWVSVASCTGLGVLFNGLGGCCAMDFVLQVLFVLFNGVGGLRGYEVRGHSKDQTETS